MSRLDVYKDGKGTQFSSTNQPVNRGRRKNRLRELIDNDRISLDELRIILENLATSHSFADIEQMLNNGKEDLPAFVAMFLKAFVVDWRKGSLNSVELLMDRVWGKAVQAIDMTSTGNMSLTLTTPEDRKKHIQELLKKIEL